MTFLDRILQDVREELAAAKSQRSNADVRAMLLDAPPVRSLSDALKGPFGLIAEIKERSPSVGPMRRENVLEAPAAYEACDTVKVVSVLTNEVHFGMKIERLMALRKQISKPLLRKDFIIDEYQIREARAFGADAILLMANVLDPAQLKGFYDLARELDMQALFEVHTEEEIHDLPHDAQIIGINSRKFKSNTGFVATGQSSTSDFSVNLEIFDLVESLPPTCIKVAESGLSEETIISVRTRFNAALIGTSLLRDERGVMPALRVLSEKCI